MFASTVAMYFLMSWNVHYYKHSFTNVGTIVISIMGWAGVVGGITIKMDKMDHLISRRNRRRLSLPDPVDLLAVHQSEPSFPNV